MLNTTNKAKSHKERFEAAVKNTNDSKYFLDMAAQQLEGTGDDYNESDVYELALDYLEEEIDEYGE